MKNFILLLTFAAFPFCNLIAQTTPEEVLLKYLQMRFEGTAYTNFPVYDNLKVYGKQFAEPGWDTYYIVDTFYINKTEKDDYLYYIDIAFKTYGAMGGDEFIRKDTLEIIKYYMVNTVKGWKLLQPLDNPRVPPTLILRSADKSLSDLSKMIEESKNNDFLYNEYKRWYKNRFESYKKLKEIVSEKNSNKELK